MTKIQLEHHTEQMEAVRNEFQNLWRERILPTAINLEYHSTTERSSRHKLWEHIAWHAFKAAKGM